MFNDHVAKYWRWKAFIAHQEKHWMAYEFFKQWAYFEVNGWPE